MNILMGITGGIAAYKTAALVSHLVQADYGVTVIMTESATKLVCPKLFEALSGRPVRTDVFDSDYAHMHIQLGAESDIFCVAPCSANFLAKAASGIANDLLSTVYLSFVGPVLLAPAMNTNMWEKAAVQRNYRQLMKDGVHMVGPESGRLSCGSTGTGRMTEPEQIFKRIVQLVEAPKKKEDENS